jgi:hypothetical protein
MASIRDRFVVKRPCDSQEFLIGPILAKRSLKAKSTAELFHGPRRVCFGQIFPSDQLFRALPAAKETFP